MIWRRKQWRLCRKFGLPSLAIDTLWSFQINSHRLKNVKNYKDVDLHPDCHCQKGEGCAKNIYVRRRWMTPILTKRCGIHVFHNAFVVKKPPRILSKYGCVASNSCILQFVSGDLTMLSLQLPNLSEHFLQDRNVETEWQFTSNTNLLYFYQRHEFKNLSNWCVSLRTTWSKQDSFSS